MKPNTPPIVLCFAASDPTGGAGIQADLMTICCHGAHPFSTITAITVQNTQGVEAVLPIDAIWVEKQARLVLEDKAVAAIKLGVLGSETNIASIARILDDYPRIPVILDPILASGRGDILADANMIDAIIAMLIPRTTIITPNSTEIRRLTAGTDNQQRQERPLAECAAQLIAMGATYVLVTGSHEDSIDVVNRLYDRTGMVRQDTWKRLPATYHGSGCTLASALAANIACGHPLEQSVLAAQKYTWHTLLSGFEAGKGQLIPNRFYES